MITQTTSIVEEYTQGTSLLKLSRKYHKDPAFFREILHKAGVTLRKAGCGSRKYTADDTYFDTINNATKAYFLGLMYADGCNYHKTSTIQIQLQRRDCAVLEALNKDIKNQRPIVYFTRKTKKGETHEYGMLRINSKPLSERLVALGCFHRKSETLAAPPVGSIPAEFKKSFILGFFDGDGSIAYYKKKDQYSMMFICNALFKDYIERLLRDELGLHATSLLRKKRKSSVPLWQITVGSIPGMVKLINWMCSAETDKLQITRKRERMLAILEKMETYQSPSERSVTHAKD